MSIDAAEPGRPLGTVTGIALPSAARRDRRDGGNVPDVSGEVMSTAAPAPSTAPGGKQR